MKKEIYVFWLLIVSIHCFGQAGSHYWSHQYGSKGLLMNGAVIASPEDETSIFYNPGAMGLDKQLGFAFSFLTPSYSDLKINNLVGDDVILNHTQLTTSPGFIAGRFRPFSNKNIVVGATTFKRYKTDYSFQNQSISSVEYANGSFVRSDFDFSNKISEDWIGIGIAYKVSDNIGIGITQYIISHTQSKRLFLKKEVLEPQVKDGVLQSWHANFDYRISIFGASLTKLGFAYKSSNLKFGLTFTSPTFGRIRSSASYSFEDQRYESENGSNLVATNRENTTLVDFKNASSIGIGIEFNRDNFGFALSSEYFSKVNEFTYLEITGTPFTTSPESFSVNGTKLTTKKKSIINVALAVQYQYSPRTTFISGCRTDFNQQDYVSINQNNQYFRLTPDIYHLTLGTLHRGPKNMIAVGVDVGFGKSFDGRQLIDLANINSTNFYTLNGKDNVTSQYRSITLFFTYDFLFGGNQGEE